MIVAVGGDGTLNEVAAGFFEGATAVAPTPPEFEPEPLPVHIIYAPRKPVPVKLRAFLNWMTPRLKARLTLT